MDVVVVVVVVEKNSMWRRRPWGPEVRLRRCHCPNVQSSNVSEVERVSEERVVVVVVVVVFVVVVVVVNDEAQNE